MTNLSSAELHLALSQLDQALHNHEQWYKNIVRALIARLPAEAADLQDDAHKRCRFGQWYESPEASPLRDHAAFIALGQAHRQMHQVATSVLRHSDEGLPVLPAELDAFNNVLDRMRLELQSLRRELSEALQNRDPLTGARNRTNLLLDLREQQALVRRNVQACAVAMLDLDHFKRINDQHGHPAGDAVLVATVQHARNGLRPYDHVYRYGGEEFLLCLPNATPATAMNVAERVREAIASSPVAIPNGTQVRVTASLGLASLDGTEPVEVSIDRADKALYQAKLAGRNCVRAYEKR